MSPNDGSPTERSSVIPPGNEKRYFDQGLAGAQQATITGLVFGTVFALTGRIWMLMSAHAAFDLTAVAIIYMNLESAVAHMIFPA
jgi:membrane protease YdiL (CAAX protease family)